MTVYKCTACGAIVPDRSQLRNHVMQVHGKVFYRVQDAALLPKGEGGNP